VDGCTLVCSATRVWKRHHVLAALARVGRGWHAATAVAGLPGGAQRPRKAALGRVFRGRELRSREKGGLKVGKTKRGKGTKWMVLVDGQGTPLGVHLDSASPAEVTLLETTLETVAVSRAHHAGRPRQRPERLILDRAYDSNALRHRLAQRGIEPIIPVRSNNTKATHQDGRKLRRYRHRWIVERTFAWFGWFRRLLVGHERHAHLYLAFFYVACALITLRQVLK